VSELKLNRKSPRLKKYDYSIPGYYFVTICTLGMKEIFGEIKNGKMNLNKLGKIVFTNWENISTLHHGVELDEFIIMPNHIHGIIIVVDAKVASTTNRSKMTLSKLIQQFKRACTIEISSTSRLINDVWQRSFYDRIIRNEDELYQIRKYIQQNSLKWELEKESPENIDL